MDLREDIQNFVQMNVQTIQMKQKRNLRIQ